MAEVIDLTAKPNRVLLAFDIFIGTLMFSDCYPTEPTSSYVWRRNRYRWIQFINWLFRDPEHCRISFEHSKQHLFDAPEYRQ